MTLTLDAVATLHDLLALETDGLTATDAFCGAGGNTLGALVAGVETRVAMNHWPVAVDVHQRWHPNTIHECADISQTDPRRFERTDILMASPECTNHSQARGVSRRRQDPSLFDAPDPAAERSRATMWDVPRLCEQMLYDAAIVENVVEATKWVGWRAWHLAMADLGYEHRVVSTNSMHHGVPQSRDRIFVVFWRKGLHVNLDREVLGWCARCDAERVGVQAWKAGRSVGRYRQQWVWRCVECSHEVVPPTLGAETILDWELPCPRIGDRQRPLAAATRARILAGLQRYGWAPIITAGAGNTYETTPGNRARPLTDPLPVQQASATHALAHPPAYIVRQFTARGNTGQMTTPVEDPLRTLGTTGGPSLLIPLRGTNVAKATDQPLDTIAANGQHHGLLMRNQTGGAEMITPTDQPIRTVTTKGHQSLLMPYYGTGQAQPVDRPVPTVPTRDRFALVDPDTIVDDCGFRMLAPHEIAAAMAFPDGYIPDDLTNRDRVKLAGNAVTWPVMAWIVGQIREALAS